MGLRDLPAVHRLIGLLAEVFPDVPAQWLLEAARASLEQARQTLRAGNAQPSIAQIVAHAEHLLRQRQQLPLRPVINATGVIVHTNLGRAPLSAAAQQAIISASAGYSNLEYDLAQGERGSRNSLLEPQLQRLTGAEAALVVNNAAAAMLLCLSCFAQGREVIVSRGHAVEIGGGFRIPDILRQSGCTLVDVGTTNRSYLHDYTAAITNQTAVLLHVHASNFQVLGFTHEPSVAELAQAAHAQQKLLICDLGSGALLDTQAFGLAAEPTVQQLINDQADLVVFSGDKLLGGPQAGLIVGKRSLIDQLRKHPLLRALRVDKLTIAALSATLMAYETQRASHEIPIWRMLGCSLAELEQRALPMLAEYPAAQLVATHATIGGGSLPGSSLPSRGLALDGAAEALSAHLRANDPPIVGRIHAQRLILDLRTVLPEQDAVIVAALAALNSA
ncbi:L-seryl-tRNA(Sec) selenium transferase [Herpetosiphon geysericola]|uniref:L-seryl-tRNA(Sec) selenium transferase n=1 Tax=Herpetosiphon geysericola TaxID=70996 RepID=A0A0P6Z103_9CHLR|nr:L-seryl-tRNA(Sec) selenium transferase [Herpetosiphon geysericola]KPL90627.1 selenocysteine synthase [Herpetosiphon geysericola]